MLLAHRGATALRTGACARLNLPLAPPAPQLQRQQQQLQPKHHQQALHRWFGYTRECTGSSSCKTFRHLRGPAGGVFCVSPKTPEGPSVAPSGWFRSITYYPQRKVVGHRLEILVGKHRRRRLLPPKVPLHPLASAAAVAAARAAPGVTAPAAPQQDMTLFEAYRDLQLRWKRTTRQSRKKFCIARKWRHHLACQPHPEPSWLLFLHPQMGGPQRRLQEDSMGSPPQQRTGRRRASKATEQQMEEEEQQKQEDRHQLLQHNGDQAKQQQHDDQVATIDAVGGFRRLQGTHSEKPPPLLSANKEDIFCVFKSSVSAQHKEEWLWVEVQVTVGDLVQTEKLHRKQAGDKVVFGTVLLAGTREWTLLGKPTIPFAKVKGVIEQQTLAGETLSFRYKKTRRSSRFLRIRHWVTLIRIEDIEIDTEMKADPPPEPPKRLLDLWANRWLYPEELAGIKTDAQGKPLAESIYDGTEHQQGTYHRRGLAACYRWLPDPQATHWKR